MEQSINNTQMSSKFEIIKELGDGKGVLAKPIKLKIK